MDAVVSAVIGDMVSRAISFLAGRFRDQQIIENKLRTMSHELIKIQSVVEEAEGRQITSHGLLEWLSELIDGMYQGRYLLDDFRCESLDLEEEHEENKEIMPNRFALSLSNPAKRLCVAASTVKNLFHDDGVNKLDSVLENLQSISGDIREFIMLMQSCPSIHRPITTNIYLDSQMFGRHVEREKIINFLLQDDANLGILPIIGDTGVGKTTLVQHVCDDNRVRNHFPLIMLVDFFSMYPMANGEARVVLRSKFIFDDMWNFNEPMQVLKCKLRQERFLVVFENVDMHKKQKLEELLQHLGCVKQGSKIIVTSRDKDVARIGTVEPIKLWLLPHTQYWFFFKAHAFPGTDVEENPRLLAIGKAIAMKLKGSFFGAKIVGPLLRAHPNPQFWCKVLRSDLGELLMLDDSLGYISDVAERFIPRPLKMCTITIASGCPRIALHNLQDISRESSLDGEVNMTVANKLHISNILLCKSVFPLYCLYYTAHCTVDGAISDQSSFRFHLQR